MTEKASRRATPAAIAAAKLPRLIRAGLDTLDFGFAIFDGDLKLVATNTAFRTLRACSVTSRMVTGS